MTDDQTVTSHGLRAVLAVAIALSVNTVLFLVLAALNDSADTEGQRQAELEVVRLAPRRTTPRLEPTPPRPPEPDPEPMEVSLDMPVVQAEPQLKSVTQVPLDVDTPTITPVRVAVLARPIAKPAPPTPVRRATPPKRPTSPSPPAVVSTEDLDGPLNELGAPEIEYPRSAARKRLRGTVTIRLLVNTQGRVEEMRIVRVDGSRIFRDAVPQALSAWRFSVPRSNGRPVKVWATKTIRFKPTR